MRSGVCLLQQTLTAEAAAALKHSLALARRRGHAQVTPLHVAATLLAARAGLLTRACQLAGAPGAPGRALELCFNVALNRLPAAPGPLLHSQPSLSNALVAALKRAQAHHRRGAADQQPLLAAKVELEQLVVSILDDPSVSRVMREAGFSSTAVKSTLEDSSVFHCFAGAISGAGSGGFFSLPCSPRLAAFGPPAKEDDVRSVLSALSRRKKRSVVLVGDSPAAIDGILSELTWRFQRGNVPETLRGTRFVEFRLSLGADVAFSELKRKVADSLSAVGSDGGGVVVYIGDLKWTVEDGRERDHLVEEVTSLIGRYDAVWIMASASYQTYVTCQAKKPSLEIQWSLQAVSVPSGGLGLSLHASSR